MVHIGLHKRYRVHLCVSFSCFLGVIVGNLMVMYVESVVRHRSKVRVSSFAFSTQVTHVCFLLRLSFWCSSSPIYLMWCITLSTVMAQQSLGLASLPCRSSGLTWWWSVVFPSSWPVSLPWVFDSIATHSKSLLLPMNISMERVRAVLTLVQQLQIYGLVVSVLISGARESYLSQNSL